MPIIKVSKREFFNLLGKKLDDDKLEELLMNIKCEIDNSDDNYFSIEIKDFYRVDLFSTPGLVKEIKGMLGIEEGIPKIDIEKSDVEVYVYPYNIYPSNKNAERSYIFEKRPYFVGAVVKDLKLDEDRIIDLIQLQEKITESFGKRREKIAIGIHNFDLIKPPIYYQLADPQLKFIPLKENKEKTLIEILNDTESGKKYGKLVEGYDYYPILRDSAGKIISFPPIINSNDIGFINEKTKNVFIDITGDDLNKMLIALNSFLIAFKYYGGKIYSIKIKNILQDIYETPVVDIKEKEFDLNKIKKFLGLNISDNEIINILRKRRFDVSINKDKIKVRYFYYRNDILSEFDIIEEILVGYGYSNIKKELPSFYTKGEITRRREIMNLFRNIMVRMGFTEFYTPVLSNRNINSIFSEDKEIIELINPVSLNYNSVRVSPIVSMLQTISENKNFLLPLEAFEVGRVGYKINNRVFEEDILGIVYINSKISFSDLKSILERIFYELNLDYSLERSERKFLIKGRQANIITNNKVVGYIGELDPNVNEILNISYPIGLIELSLSKIYDI